MTDGGSSTSPAGDRRGAEQTVSVSKCISPADQCGQQGFFPLAVLFDRDFLEAQGELKKRAQTGGNQVLLATGGKEAEFSLEPEKPASFAQFNAIEVVVTAPSWRHYR